MSTPAKHMREPAAADPEPAERRIAALQVDVAALHRAAEAQAEQIAALMGQVETLTRREAELWEMLIYLHEEILACQVGATGGAGTGSLDDQYHAPDRGDSPKRLDYQEYRQLIERLRAVVGSVVPANALVAVVSRGDDELLKLGGRRAWHFPQRDDGVYAGHYPATSAEAIAHLEALRARGAEYLLLPSTAFWWLDHYGELRQHLEERYSVVLRQEDTGILFSLHEEAPQQQVVAEPSVDRGYRQLVEQVRQIVRNALPADATIAVISRGDDALLRLDGRRAWHFPQQDDGAYAGHYPATSAEAIAHLEALRARGAEYLLLPSTTFWWLDHYGELRQHLETHYRLVVRQQFVCFIFALHRGSARSHAAQAPSRHRN